MLLLNESSFDISPTNKSLSSHAGYKDPELLVFDLLMSVSSVFLEVKVNIIIEIKKIHKIIQSFNENKKVQDLLICMLSRSE